MQSLLDPAILFFLLGMAAGLLRSNLELPQSISKFLSLYLLMALGLKGGFALHVSGLNADVTLSLLSAIAMAVIVPAIGYMVLKRQLNGFDAAAVAATYGSVSAVTFITAVQYLDNRGIPYGGHMAAAMALMESPAIIMAIVLTNLHRKKMPLPQGGTVQSTGLKQVLHESLTDGAQVLLIGAMLIGIITGPSGQAAMKPFTGDLFKGMLAFFLLDMGLNAARNMGQLRGESPWLALYAIVGPLAHAALALGWSMMVGLKAGDAALLMVLTASASYIAVPAVIRHAIPEAKPSLYFGMSLGLTFPFNILAGIPLYMQTAQWVLPQ